MTVIGEIKDEEIDRLKAEISRLRKTLDQAYEFIADTMPQTGGQIMDKILLVLRSSTYEQKADGQ